ncbi:MAG: 50S ribosomal protein L17 [Nitrospinae bacterium]|nr:50S ribosomal protein L17 [Nitrospinota bacterium]
MRHLKAGVRRFGRTQGHRKALFRNLVSALIARERIRTTLTKAKELRSKVEKVITLGKKGTVHARRLALRHVAQRETLKKLFGPLSERYAARNGGYTRIIRIGPRHGDDAPMAFIELVDREAEKKAEPAEKAKRKEAKSAPEKKAPKAGAKEEKPKAKKAGPAKETAKKTKDDAPKKPKTKKTDAQSEKKKEEK